MKQKYNILNKIRISILGFFFLIGFLVSCNTAKPIDLDISKPSGLGAFVLQEIGASATTPPTDPDSPPPPDCSTTDSCFIFEVASVLGTFRNGAMGGISGADAACRSAAQAYLSGDSFGNPNDYKALIMAEGGVRDLTHNWVLHPNTTYRNPGTGLIVQDTDANGMLGLPVANPISESAPVSMYTGIDTSGTVWRPKTNGTCLNWTSASSADRGEVGDTAEPNYIDRGFVQPCDSNFGLYCVRK